MNLLTRFVFPLVAYFCVATVITLLAGYGYMRHTGTLSNERLFRIVSIVHGIDLQEIAEAQQVDDTEVPPEELSFGQQQKHIQISALHLQAKKDDVEKQLSQFESQLNLLNKATERYNRFKNEVEDYLKQRQQDAVEEGLLAVRGQLQNLDPKKQSKPLLIELIKKDRSDLVILLLNGMSSKKRSDILETFQSEEEIKMLHDLQQEMLQGHPENTYLNDKLRELDELNQETL